MHFKGQAWAIFESLGNSEKDMYAHLKGGDSIQKQMKITW